MILNLKHKFLLTAALAVLSVSAEAQIKIMAVGDSITAGFTFSPPDGTGLGTASYRKEFANVLDQSGCFFDMVGSRTRNDPENPFVFGGVRGKHEGYSGHRADHFINGNGLNLGIDVMMQTETPDVVLLHLGSNDMNSGQPVTQTVNEIEDVITRILNANSNATVFVANVIPWWGDSNNSIIQASIQSLGTQITNRVNALGNPNVILTDVRSGYTQSLMQADLIHPNEDGEAHIADAFAAAMEDAGVCASFDTIEPTTTIAIPSAGSTVPGNTTFSGTATDTGASGFNRVNIAIERTTDGQWLNFSNGSFGPISVNGNDVGITTATLTNTTLTSTNWNFSVNLPGGSYRLYALAVDNAGNDAFQGNGLSVWPVNTEFQTIVDTQDPTSTITTPAASGASLASSLTFTGTATDSGGSGIDSVEIAIRRTGANSQWFDFNGGFSGSIKRELANLTGTTMSNKNWNLPVSLTPGNYRVYAISFDGAGNNSGFFTRDFVVAVPDDIDPTGKITNPAIAGATLPQDSTLAGTASDTGGSGFDSVEIAIRRTGANSQWFDFNGGFSNSVTRVPANLTGTTTANSNWNLPVSLPPGNYRVQAIIFDGARNNSGWIRQDFVVAAPDGIDPTGKITNPATDGAILLLNSALAGTASDTGGSGFDSVEIAIRRTGANSQWFDFNGGFSDDPVRQDAFLFNTSNTSTNWSMPAALPPGNYRVQAIVFDAARNNSGWIRRDFVVQ